MMHFPVLRMCAVLVVVGIVWSAAATPRSVKAASATAAASLELRAAPAADAAVLLVVPSGAPLSLDGPPQGEFYPVTFEGTTGWAPAAGLVVTKDAAAMDPAPPGGELAPVAPTATLVPMVEPPVSPTAVPVAPTEVATSVPVAATSVPPETTAVPTAVPEVATVVDPSPAPTLPEAPAATIVSTASPEPSPAATETVTTEALPTLTVSATETIESAATAASTPTSQGTSTVEPTATDAPTAAAPTSETTIEPTATTEPTATPRPIVRGPASATINLSLLAQPIAGAEILFTVPAGSTLTRMGSYVNGYVSADFMGILGWVDFDLLAEPLAPEPEPEPTVDPTPTATAETTESGRREPRVPSGVGAPGSGVAYTSNDLSLRSGPSASYPELSSIPAGEQVALTGVMEGGFVRVEYGDEIGWVSTSLLGMPPDPTPETARRGVESRRVYSREEIVQVIYAAADRYDQPRADMLRVAQCESNLDPYAVNASGSYGIFQFVGSTWESTPYANRDIFDPRANASAAGWMWSVGRRNEWVCQ